MKRLIALLLPLVGCACTPNVMYLSAGAPAPAPAGMTVAIGRYGDGIDASSLWVDRTGAIYLTDRARWRVLSYRRDGDSCVLRYELNLRDPGLFLVPGHDDGFCLADNSGRRLLFYSSQGSPTGEIAIEGHTISAAAISGAGDVFVLDIPQRTIMVYGPAGALIGQYPLPPGTAPFSGLPGTLAVSRSGTMIALADGETGTVTLYTAFGRRFGQYRTRAVSLAFDSYDRLWSLDGDGRIGLHYGFRPERGTTWSDSVRMLGTGNLIAVGAGDAVVTAANGLFYMCR
jgi:hypothetical protein